VILLFFIPFYSINAQQGVVNNPVGNFEILWKTFDERYANFELKKVDWNAIYQKYRPQINAQTTDLE